MPPTIAQAGKSLPKCLRSGDFGRREIGKTSPRFVPPSLIACGHSLLQWVKTKLSDGRIGVNESPLPKTEPDAVVLNRSDRAR